MKILVVSNMYPDDAHPYYGVFVRKFVEEAEKLGVETELAVMKKQDGRLAKLLAYALFYMQSFLKPLFFRWDLVYVHYASHSSPAVLAARRLKRFRIITNVHGSDVVPENPKQERMQRYTCRILQVSDAVVVPSEYFKGLVTEKYGLDKKTVFVYPSGGIDPGVFFPVSDDRRQALRTALGIRSGQVTIGMAGRISRDKGWDVFVRAARDASPDRRFFLAGSGDEEQALRQCMKEAGTTACIYRLPMLPQEKLADFYRAMDVLVFPTKRAGESLGLVPLEAMACGTPVIASDYAAPRDYMRDGVNGRVFEMGNAQALQQRLQTFPNPATEEYARMREGALRTAEAYAAPRVRHILQEILQPT